VWGRDSEGERERGEYGDARADQLGATDQASVQEEDLLQLTTMRLLVRERLPHLSMW